MEHLGCRAFSFLEMPSRVPRRLARLLGAFAFTSSLWMPCLPAHADDVEPGGGLRFASGNSVSAYASLGEPLSKSAAGEPVSKSPAVITMLQQSAGIGLGGAAAAVGVSRADGEEHHAKVALDLEVFRSWWKSSWPTATYLGPQVRLHLALVGGFCGLLWAWSTSTRLMTCGFTLGLD
jgi:hypothetical protein